MQRKQDGMAPIGETFSGETSPQVRHHFTQAETVLALLEDARVLWRGPWCASAAGGGTGAWRTALMVGVALVTPFAVFFQFSRRVARVRYLLLGSPGV